MILLAGTPPCCPTCEHGETLVTTADGNVAVARVQTDLKRLFLEEFALPNGKEVIIVTEEDLAKRVIPLCPPCEFYKKETA